MEQNVIEKNVDMTLISEQYRNKNFGEWVTNNSKKGDRLARKNAEIASLGPM